MASYNDFALFYDRLMKDVDYKKRSEYILNLFKKHGKMPTLLLDLACGTGNFSNQMALKGIEVIGVDMSEDMLSAARENSCELGTDLLYLCQKGSELDLFGTVDGAICCMDSLNHITDIKELEKTLKRVSLFMEEDSLFIFDLNTIYKHEQVLANNTFVIEDEEVFCVWQNRYDKQSRTTEITLDFFAAEGEAYFRYGEEFCEKAYTDEEIIGLLEKAGLELVAIYDDMTESPVRMDSERAVFVAKKKK